MCGIVGVVALSDAGVVGEEDLMAMRDRMIARGPDDAGLYIHREDGLFVGLGHRRLSIIDLSPLGRQPMSTADGLLWIVFNGEIFNYRELRQILERTGRHRFRSQTDTEVILYGIREWGLEGCLRRLRGMYAFALFDKAEGSLTLVRDPLGVKPLYYLREPARLVFASEIKAILALPDLHPRIDETALYHYLTFAHAPAPRTLFDGILKLEAGTYLRMDRDSGAMIRRYWDPRRLRPDDVPTSEQAAVEELRRLLRQSVVRRLVSDVPVGFFLSGGLDSSLNVALMAERMDRPVETFTVGLQGDPANEFHHARFVAERFGARHHEILLSDEEFFSFLPRMAYAQDEPLADPVCVPLYYLSKLARDSGIPVIQVGEGSDELFAGYPIYHLFNRWDRRVFRPYQALPRPVKALLYRLAAGRLRPDRADALRRGLDGDPLFLGNAVAFWDSEKAGLLKTPAAAGLTSSGYVRALAAPENGGDPLLHMIQVELRNRLPELLLMRVDKMSMAASIETRVPYLDEDLVAFALALPSHLRFAGGQPKSLLRAAARGIVPDACLLRKKWGFCGSATTMLRQRLVWYAYARIMESPLVAERFNRNAIERLFLRHRTHKRFNSFKIWNLLNLVLWHECWFERRGAATQLARKSLGTQRLYPFRPAHPQVG